MAKKITAPHSYDPGKGRPKEYLAYLNQREMAYLRSINGNNMERGPRGLPSFPPDDSLGSSSNNSKPSGGGSTNSGAGRDSSRGIGQGAGGTAVGRGAGGLGGGSKGTANSPSGASKASTASTSGTSKAPSSPMGGQGTSFSTPSAASSYNADRSAQQRAQVNDARSAISKSPSVRNDLASGGIRTLSVGPMGSPVNVGRPVSESQKFKSPQAGYKYSSPLTPGTSPEDMARRGAMMNQMEQEIRDIMRQGVYTRTGDPISAGGVPTTSFSGPRKTRGIGGPPSVPSTGYSGATFNPESEIQKAAVDRALIESAMARSLGPVSKPAPVGMSGSFISAANATVPGPTSSFSDELRRAMTPDINISAPPNPDERILEVENFPERPTYAAGTYTSPYDRTPQGYTSVAGGMGMSPFNRTPSDERLNPQSVTTDFSGKFSSDFARATNAAQRDARYGGSWSSGDINTEGATYPGGDGVTSEGVVNDYPSGVADLSPESWSETPYGEPGDIQREKDIIDKHGRYVPGYIGLASRVKTAAHDAIWKGMSPEERIDRINKNNRMDQDRIRGLNGNENDRGPYIPPPRETRNYARSTSTETASEGSRPAAYYRWDIGVGIPSPSDADYTLYMKYLQEKAANEAGAA